MAGTWHDTTHITDHIPTPEEITVSPVVDMASLPPTDYKEEQALYELTEERLGWPQNERERWA